jgi:voltage-gated potassium channel
MNSVVPKDDESNDIGNADGRESARNRSSSFFVSENLLLKLQREGTWLTRRRLSVFRVLEDPDSSGTARIVGILIMSIVLFSVVSFITETDYEYRKNDYAFFKYSEYFTTGFFLLEYLARLSTCSVLSTQTVWGFTRSPMNLIDLLAILPTFIELLAQGGSIKTLRVLRAVRLVRLFRLLKLGRYSVGMQLIANTIKQSKSELQVMYFIIGIAVVVFGSLIFFLERLACPNLLAFKTNDRAIYEAECSGSLLGTAPSSGARCCDADGRPKGFRSVFDAFWLCITCFLTVGYGDLANVTTASKLVGGLSYILGVVLLSMPIGILSTQFNLVYRQTVDQEFAFKKELAELQATLLLAVDHQHLLVELRQLKNQPITSKTRTQLKDIRTQLNMINTGTTKVERGIQPELFQRLSHHPDLTRLFHYIQQMEIAVGQEIQIQAIKEKTLTDFFLHLELISN